MPIVDLSDIKKTELIPGFNVRFVHSEKATLAFWDIRAGSILPEHSHFHEQIAQLIEGSFELTIDGITTALKPGMLAVIPPNAVHSGIALTDCKMVDVFSPVREDYKFPSG